MTEHDGSRGLRAVKVIPGGCANSGQRSIEGLDGLVIALSRRAPRSPTTRSARCRLPCRFGLTLTGDLRRQRRSRGHPDRAQGGPDGRRSHGTRGAVGRRAREVDQLSGKGTADGDGQRGAFHAIRLARAATRRLSVKFQGCYDGWHAAVALNVISLRVVGQPDRFPREPGGGPKQIVLPFNDSSAAPLFEAQSGDIAAVILEPIPITSGRPPAAGFLETLRSCACAWNGPYL